MSEEQTVESVEPNLELSPGNVKGAMKAVGASSSDLYNVPRSAIRIIEGFNVRSPASKAGKEHVKNLAALIEANGYDDDKPLAGYVAKEDGEDVIYLTDGEHRLAAIDLLIAKGKEFDILPVKIKPRGTSMEDLTISLATANSGKPLTPLELASVVKRLQGYRMDDKTIAKRLNITKKYLDDLLTLVAAPVAIRDLVTNGKISSTMAISTLKEHPNKAVEKLQAAVAKAEAAGKTKATPKALRPAKHLDDIMVDQLAKLMKQQLAAKRAEGKEGWETRDVATLQEGVDKHVHGSTAEARIDHMNYLAMVNYVLSQEPPVDEQPAGESEAEADGDL